MKTNFWMKLMAAILACCLFVTTVSAVQIVRVYAEEESMELEQYDEGGGWDEDNWDDGDDEPDGGWDDNQPDTEPNYDSNPEPQQPEEVDPFDYNLMCYTPSIGFGEIYKGDIVPPKQFTIVNVGSTTFPLTWEEIDAGTAFLVECLSSDLYMDPGESITFMVTPNNQLKAGKYTANLTFFSENDYRRHHVAKVDLSATIRESAPYITGVEVYPGQITVPAGKTYQFDADVRGGNGYSDAVTWSVTGNQSSGTKIDSKGKLTVAANEGSGAFGVIATSKQDPSYADTAIVSVSSVDYIVSVKADPSEGGAVAGGGSVAAGGKINVSASPNNNFSFDGWYEGGNLVSVYQSFSISNVSSDRNLIAKFSREGCYIRTSVNDKNGGTITKSKTVAYGGKMTITAKANSGYKFEGFVENKKTISEATSLELNNITSDRDIIAVFKREVCNVNVSVNPQDTGKYEGAGKYNKGSKVTLKAKAYDGYQFSGWTISGQVVSKDEKYTIDNIKGDVNVVANFMKKDAQTYKLVSGIATGGGSIIPSGDYVVAQGGSVTYNIVPQSDYRITAVIVDGKNIGAVSSYTFNNVKGGHTITASFEKKPVEAPKATSQSKTAANNTSAKTAAKKETTEAGKTEYNRNTAAEGALPEQNRVDEIVPEETTQLEGEEYEEDTYIEATEVPEEETPSNSDSVMAKHDIDEATLRILINDNAVKPMLKEAFEDGTLRITVNNGYAEDTQETAVELYYQKPTLINFEDVIVETLSADEKYAVLTGTPISFNVNINENTETVDEGVKELMQKKVGYKPVSYFDFTIMKTSDGVTKVIEKTDAELEVVVPIPEKYRKDGRKFFVIRNHNGKADVLQDIGNDPTTITFRTDKFSEYAIAYEAVNINKLVLRVVIGGAVSFVLAIICYINLVIYRRKARRARRAAAK